MLGDGYHACSPMVETALFQCEVARANLYSVSKKGREKKKKRFHQESFLDLSWPHLGLHLEISRQEISPRKLSSPLSWPHLGLHLENSRLEISPRKLS